MVNAMRVDLGVASNFPGVSLEFATAATFDCFASVGQIGEKAAHLPAHCGTGSQALVGGGFLTRPAPDGLVSVGIWAAAG